MLFPDLIDDTTNYVKKDIRGSIYDRNGNIIATSIESISLSINPNKIKNKKELANKLGLILNLILVFSMIFIANNTREIEKNNIYLKMKISKISENLKINKIELATHQNSSYLKTLYELYFYKTQNSNVPLIVKLKELSNQDKNIKLVSSNN